MAYTVRMGIRIRAPREFVFQHLLTAHHLARWFCNFAQFDPKGPAIGTKVRFGGDYAIAATEPPGWACEILGGEVLRSVSLRWPLFDADTRVDWRVEEAPDGSVMRVAHSGLPREDSTCGSFRDAWRVCLGNLKAVTEARDDSLRPDSTPLRPEGFLLDLLVNAPAPKVFGALVEPDAVRAWAEGAGPVEIEPRPGGTYSMGWPGGRGTLERLEPAKSIAIRWNVRGVDARSTFRLEEKAGNRTGVYAAFEGTPSDPSEGLRFRGRWTDLLVGMKNALEAGSTGFTEPYEEQLTRE